MTSYPVEIRRCRHIKTNGTQCGSPALKEKELCFYHDQNRPAPAQIYLDGEEYCDSTMMIPVFEDAHSIQTVIRHVVQLMLCRRIDRKDAGLMLYALQIASGNLKTMQAEKAKPTQVVVDPEKAGETPLGMTPWSASGQGHDLEEGELEDEPDPSQPPAPPTLYERYNGLSRNDRDDLMERYRNRHLFTEQEYDDFLHEDGPDPIWLAMQRLDERRRQARAENLGAAGGDGVGPGTIQGCAGRATRRAGRDEWGARQQRSV